MPFGLDDAVAGWLVSSLGTDLVRRLRGKPAQSALRSTIENAVQTTVESFAGDLDEARARHLLDAVLTRDVGTVAHLDAARIGDLDDALAAWTAALDEAMPGSSDNGYLTNLGIDPSAFARDLAEQIRAGIMRQGRSGGPLHDVAEWLWRDQTDHNFEEVKGLLRDETRAYRQPSTTVGSLRRPACLPGGPSDFTGRTALLDTLSRRLEIHRPEGDVVAIHALDGMPGIGKTALAVHVAHQVKHRYPDGQYFVDLHGYTPGLAPLDLRSALEELLNQAGERGPFPRDLGALQNRWRAVMASRRALVLIDNALDAQQVRPLLPMAAGCLVLITSRSRLAGLTEATSMAIDSLPESEAVDLLVRLVGADRCPSRSRCAEIVRLTGYLPLAIKVIAGRAANDAALTMDQLAADLADAQQRLDETSTNESGVRTAFQVSIDRLEDDLRLAFRWTGQYPGPRLGTPQFAALAGIPVQNAARLLRSLADRNLLTPATTVGHRTYTQHDLLRLYAREHAEAAFGTHDLDSASSRLIGWYESALRHVASLGVDSPPIAAPDGLSLQTATEAGSWLSAEEPNLAALNGSNPDSPAMVTVMPLFVGQLIRLGMRLDLPSRLAAELHHLGTAQTLRAATESATDHISTVFFREYLSLSTDELMLAEYEASTEDGRVLLTARLLRGGSTLSIGAKGNGPIDALVRALDDLDVSIRVLDYAEHALYHPSQPAEYAQAAAYIECEVDGTTLWGIGIDANIVTASLRAVLCAVNRRHRQPQVSRPGSAG